jgi:hypothetical protein
MPQATPKNEPTQAFCLLREKQKRMGAAFSPIRGKGAKPTEKLLRERVDNAKRDVARAREQANSPLSCRYVRYVGAAWYAFVALSPFSPWHAAFILTSVCLCLLESSEYFAGDLVIELVMDQLGMCTDAMFITLIYETSSSPGALLFAVVFLLPTAYCGGLALAAHLGHGEAVTSFVQGHFRDSPSNFSHAVWFWTTTARGIYNMIVRLYA